MFKREIRSIFSNNFTILDKVKNDNPGINNTFTVLEPYGLSIEGNSTIVRIESGVYFRRFCNINVLNSGELFIGNDVFFNNYCSINCLGKISIGANSIFGEGVKIYDHNHVYSFANDILNVNRNEFKIGFVDIGKNCWIGSNVTILNNVTIGDNVIIGANNLIYKSVPSNMIIKQKSEIIINNL